MVALFKKRSKRSLGPNQPSLHAPNNGARIDMTNGSLWTVYPQRTIVVAIGPLSGNNWGYLEKDCIVS